MIPSLEIEQDERGTDCGFLMVGDVRAVYQMNGRICNLRTGNWGELTPAQWDAVEGFAVEMMGATIVRIERG